MTQSPTRGRSGRGPPRRSSTRRCSAASASGSASSVSATPPYTHDPLEDNHVRPMLKVMAGLLAASAIMTYTVGTASRIANGFVAVIVAGLVPAWSRGSRSTRARGTSSASRSSSRPRPDIPTYWHPPLAFADMAYYASLKDFAGVPGLSLPIFFFGAIGLLHRARKNLRKREELAPPPPRHAVQAMTFFLVAVLSVEAWGARSQRQPAAVVLPDPAPRDDADRWPHVPLRVSQPEDLPPSAR